MTVSLQERFQVQAPIDDVWAFLTDPHRVVTCMPGAHLEKVESERVFIGSMKVAMWPFSTRYRGRVEFRELDAADHRAHLIAEGYERGGGAARGEMISSLTATETGTEVFVDMSVDGTSRIVKMGLGLTKNMANDLFRQFVTALKGRLESPGAVIEEPEAVQVVPLLARALLHRLRGKRAR